MAVCSACGAENRYRAKFCNTCGQALVSPVEIGAPDVRTELLVGAWPPGALLQERYEVVELVARQSDHATYRVHDRGRCSVCEAQVPSGDEFCPECGAELARPVACLLHEWLKPPEAVEGATFECAGRTFVVEVEETLSERLPFVQGVRLAVGLQSLKGPDLEINQDSLLALTLAPVYEGRPAPALGFFAVADGVGGHQAGEDFELSRAVASRIAVQVVAQELVSGVLMAELGGDVCLVETLIKIAGEAVAEANAQIHAVAQSRGSDMGSTLALVLVRDNLAVIASVGDSRVYHWHAGALCQVTTDHSLVERLVATGEISPEEAAGHPQKGVLYRSLGDRPSVEVDMLSLQLAPGDRLLLCCDGVWESVGSDGLEEVMLLELEPQRICDQVVRRALESGALDNVSAIVVGVTD
jgi:serine/threonine protein phosphatase PrpC